MTRRTWTVLVAFAISANVMADQPKLSAVPFTEVRIEDDFWLPRLETTRDKTLAHNFKLCETTGRIGNFSRAAGKLEGKFEGYFFNDSDVYKVLEGAAYALALGPDPELEEYVDGLIAKLAAAQQDDGYLNSYFALTPTEQRWTNLRVRHELYCAGHLLEAAIAHHQATGKRSLLDVAVRFIDHIATIFGPGKRADVPGHEEIELALVKLYKLTGEERYLKLAEFFLEQRGTAEGRELYGDYCQDHLPLAEQTEIAGHAVRAMYLYSGAVDVATITANRGYINAMDRIWEDLVYRKMYITGGIGPSSSNEGFTVAYDLPNDTAYAETCAAIGMALWNHRLNLLHRDAKYVDVLERALYNGLLSGVSLDGEKFFYTNPLGSRGNHHRKPWYKCACCPTNIVRFLPSLGGYVYATSDTGVYVNLYVAGNGKAKVGETTVTLTQKTRYPWDGSVTLRLEPERPAEFDVFLRIPDWCAGATLKVNGAAVELRTQKGYARLNREWKAGDTIELNMPMPIRRVKAHPKVEANVGRVALRRGPVVYCLEAADNSGRVRNLALPPESKLTAEHRSGLLGGVTVIKGRALAVTSEERDGTRPAEPVDFTAIPYYAWDNRAAGEMVVWIPESPDLVELPPLAGVTPSASHCYRGDTLTALCDRVEPKSSDDHTLPRFTWWSRQGSEEWVRYDFESPRKIADVAVYWFDDSPQKGGCRTPLSWRVFYLDGEQWREVRGASAYGTRIDEYNHVRFEPVETKALKIVARLQEDSSGGILEWKVGAE